MCGVAGKNRREVCDVFPPCALLDDLIISCQSLK